MSLELPLAGCLLGIDEDDEQKEEDQKGVSLLEVEVPQGLGNFRKAVARKQTAQLRREYKHRHTSLITVRLTITHQDDLLDKKT